MLLLEVDRLGVPIGEGEAATETKGELSVLTYLDDDDNGKDDISNCNRNR